MSDYKNLPYRVIDVGLNLRDAVDRVDEGKWLQLKNAYSSQEALLTTRKGRSISLNLPTSSSVHSIKRLDASTILSGAGTSLFRNTTAYPAGFSGAPLSIVPYRPESSSANWAYIGDLTQMRKVNAAGAYYKMGITAPVNAANAATAGAGNLDSSVPGGVVYDWRYTYRSSVTGAESNPSPEMAAGVACTNNAVQVTVAASADPQVDEIRIYRRGGSLPDGWLLTTTSANVSGIVTDNNSDDEISLEEPLREDAFVPFPSTDASGNALYEVPIPYLWGPFIGKYLFACGDANRPGVVVWTNPERPDTADVFNYLEVTSPSEPLMHGCVFNGQPFVFSRDELYAIDYSEGEVATFTSRKTMCGRGMISHFGLAVGPLIYFISQDGIYATDGQAPAQSITENSIRPLFHGLSTDYYSPIDLTDTEALRLSLVGNELHFFYSPQGGGDTKHLIYNLIYERWREEEDEMVSQMAYEDESQNTMRLLFGGEDGKVYLESSTTDNGSAIDCEVVTGYTDLSLPHTLKEFGNIIIDADPKGGTITVTPLLNSIGTSSPSPMVISGNGRQKFPLSLSDTYAYTIALKLSWSGPATIYQLELLWREDEEEITHWEFPETSHGMRGWQHVRDVYITLRSAEDVTLTVENDGNVETYTLPSTGGEKRKIHQWLRPRKGKLWRYKLDSGGKFRLYGEDTEVCVKGWNTANGFENTPVFAQTQGGT